GNDSACPSYPKEVKDKLWALKKHKEMKESETIRRIMQDEEVEDHTLEEGHFKGFKVQMPPGNGANARKKQATNRVHQYIAWFWYQTRLSFNITNCKSFQDMLVAVGRFRPHLPSLSNHDIRVSLLQKEFEHTNNLMNGQKKQWTTFWCSIISYAWTDRKQQCLINFLVHSFVGIMFIKFVDGSNLVNIGEKLFELLDSIVEDIGEENVAQVIIENQNNMSLPVRSWRKKDPKLIRLYAQHIA
ncbi:hypothetical protein CR513_29547, partial [Mucuna pruriens]